MDRKETSRVTKSRTCFSGLCRMQGLSVGPVLSGAGGLGCLGFMWSRLPRGSTYTTIGELGPIVPSIV